MLIADKSGIQLSKTINKDTLEFYKNYLEKGEFIKLKNCL